VDDALSRLTRAIARIGEELRARRKKKRPQRPSGPRPSGPNANKGCGTGAGGFGAGNSCAKEDGRPNAPTSPVMRPVNAKADMAKAKAMKEKAAKKQAAKIAADKAKSAAYKKSPAYLKKQKQKQIDSLRRKAAEKKREKGEREAAEKQAAAEAAAAKRAALLQKIRVKKANEQIKIVEKPADKYRGEVDQSVTKSDGETQFSFAKRRVDEDLKTLHKEMDAAEKRAENRRQEVFARIKTLEDEYRNATNDISNAQEKFLKSKTKDNQKQLEVAASAVDAAKKRLSSAYSERNSIDSDLTVEHHDLVSEFVRSHGKGLAQFKAEDQFLDAAFLEKTSSKFAPAFKDNARTAWAFLSKVAAPIHQAKGRAVKVQLDTKDGDAEYIERTEVARHGVRGNGDHNTSAGTIVHEIAHGLHYGPKPETSTLPVPSSARLPSAQQARDWIESPGYKARLAIKEDYDSRVASLSSNSPQGIEQIVYHKDRQNYKMWKPKGEQRQRESYLGYCHQYADAENGNTTGATEVMSMGVETLYRNPRMFRKDYRSHFDLTLLFLAGRLH
jgi:hypothetical protein